MKQIWLFKTNNNWKRQINISVNLVCTTLIVKIILIFSEKQIGDSSLKSHLHVCRSKKVKKSKRPELALGGLQSLEHTPISRAPADKKKTRFGFEISFKFHYLCCWNRWRTQDFWKRGPPSVFRAIPKLRTRKMPSFPGYVRHLKLQWSFHKYVLIPLWL